MTQQRHAPKPNKMEDGGDTGDSGRLKTVIEPSTLKALVAGIVIGNLNKGMLLGFTLGAVGGVFIQQNFAGVPDLEKSWKDLLHRWNKTGEDPSSKR